MKTEVNPRLKQGRHKYDKYIYLTLSRNIRTYVLGLSRLEPDKHGLYTLFFVRIFFYIRIRTEAEIGEILRIC